MLLFAFLMVTIIVLLSFTILVVGTGSAIGIIVFSDVIVCVALIVFLIKAIRNKKKK